jgi:cell wall-associated NlpC family hydrolase
MSVVTWPEKYVGTPHGEAGCWALARSIYRGELGVEIPVEPLEARRAFLEVEQPAEFDIALMRAADGWHVGVLIDRARMIHSKKGCNAVIERLGTRAARYFRYTRSRA